MVQAELCGEFRHLFPSLSSAMQGSDSPVDDCVYHLICPCCTLCQVKRDYVEGLNDSLDLVLIGAWHGNGRKAGWKSVEKIAKLMEEGVVEPHLLDQCHSPLCEMDGHRRRSSVTSQKLQLAEHIGAGMDSIGNAAGSIEVKQDYVGLNDSLYLVPIGAWHCNVRKAGW